MDIPWILVATASTLVLLAVLAVFFLKKKGWNRKIDYKNYFNMGIIWVPCGVVFLTVFKSTVIGGWFFIMGLIYLALGLKNKDKWGKPQKVSPKSQKMLMIGIALLVIGLVIGILVFEMSLL